MDDVGQSFGNPGSDRAHPSRSHKLDADLGGRVDGLEIVDQLGQVLDAVDIMVRRWADQGDARRAVAQHGNLCSHFVARQLTALTRAWTPGQS